MNFSEYQIEVEKTAIYPNVGKNIIYPTLGLNGEAGEVADIVKKIDRDDDGILSTEKREKIIKELGDTLWYLSRVCSEINISMEEVAKRNIFKLNSRKERGVLKGSGDDR